MYFEAFKGILLPFLGTSLGAACVFFMKKGFNELLRQALTGFAAGVMIAASVWSLLIPAMEFDSVSYLGRLSFLPAVIGFALGIAFLLLLDKIIPHIHSAGLSEGPRSHLGKNTMLVLSVALHNLPEGMAVGVIYAALISGDTSVTLSGALALSLGIAIQNFPEGAIISMPLRADGMKKSKAFFYGILSGIIEPIGAFFTVLALSYVVPVLPTLLGFAAGAMIYAVLEELAPEMTKARHSNIGTILFAAGFCLMMMLDVALG